MKIHSFKKLFTIVSKAIKNNYDINVSEKELGLKITGDFDGENIFIRKDMNYEMKLFILLHLFGHTVQFNTSAKLRKIGLTDYISKKITRTDLANIIKYESDASRISLYFLHEINIKNIDQWVSNWSNGDLDYLIEVYNTKKTNLLTKSFLKHYKIKYIKTNTKQLKPLKFKRFKPKKWENRFSF